MATEAERHESNSGTLMPIGKVVEQVQHTYPSVTPSSLRFLEREGLIVPTRTPGGHRLYSEADVQRILQIKEWQAQRLSLEEIHQRLDQRDRMTDPATLTRTFLQLALQGDLVGARQAILGADDVGMPLPRLFDEVLQPALIELGDGWERGTVLVSQEKTVSELVRDLIAELSIRRAAAPDGPSIVAACAPGERHELGLRMVVTLLRSQGYRVVYLGADVATRFLLEAVRLHHPDAVLLSARGEEQMDTLAEAIAAVIGERGRRELPHVVVGGEMATRHSDTITAQGGVAVTGTTVTDATSTVTRLLPFDRQGSA